MKFTVYRSRKQPRKPYRWRLQADNNEILAQGEGYKNHADCLSAIALVQGSSAATVEDKTVPKPKA